MKAMILAAGRGERMKHLTNFTPKPLTRINGKTLIEYNILKIKQSGINEIAVNICWLGSQIKNYIGTGNKYGVKITYFDEGNQMLGTGGGIYNALNFFGDEPFWLINSDVFSDYRIDIEKELINKHAHLVLVKNPEHHKVGDFYLNNDQVYFKEGSKPYTYSGISIISPKLFENCKSGVFPLEPILNDAASKGKISGEYYDGTWIDVGTPERLKFIQTYLRGTKNINLI